MSSKFTVQATEETMVRRAGGEMVCWRWEGDQHGTAAEVSGFDREVALSLPVLALQCILLLRVQAFPFHFLQVTGLSPRHEQRLPSGTYG